MIDTDKIDPDHILTTESITAQVIIIPIEATLDHNTRIDATTTGAVHNNRTQPIGATAIDLAMTHHIDHIADHPCIEALQGINSEITVDHIHDHPIDVQNMNLTDQIHTQQDKKKKDHILRRT